MNWNQLKEESQLEIIKQESHQQPVMLFKHSTRCSISSTTLNRLERNWKDDEINDLKTYYLDLLSYRNLSNKIAQEFNIEHESPQVLIIKNGKVFYDASHYDISFDEIKSHI
jgi:bacillithiol system protein YtxJ